MGAAPGGGMVTEETYAGQACVGELSCSWYYADCSNLSGVGPSCQCVDGKFECEDHGCSDTGGTGGSTGSGGTTAVGTSTSAGGSGSVPWTQCPPMGAAPGGGMVTEVTYASQACVGELFCTWYYADCPGLSGVGPSCQCVDGKFECTYHRCSDLNGVGGSTGAAGATAMAGAAGTAGSSNPSGGSAGSD
jgi:hypothetical protein